MIFFWFAGGMNRFVSMFPAPLARDVSSGRWAAFLLNRPLKYNLKTNKK